MRDCASRSIDPVVDGAQWSDKAQDVPQTVSSASTFIDGYSVHDTAVTSEVTASKPSSKTRARERCVFPGKNARARVRARVWLLTRFCL